MDDCRFSLGSMTQFLCEEDEARQYLDLSEAEVGLNAALLQEVLGGFRIVLAVFAGVW